jgi:hypothetical protein
VAMIDPEEKQPKTYDGRKIHIEKSVW